MRRRKRIDEWNGEWEMVVMGLDGMRGGIRGRIGWGGGEAKGE